MSDDVISLSSDSSRPPSPFINVSEVFDSSEKHENLGMYLCHDESTPSAEPSQKNTIKISTSAISPIKDRAVHTFSDSDSSEAEQLSNTSGNYRSFDNFWKKYGRREQDNILDEKIDGLLLDKPSTSSDTLLDKPSTSRQVLLDKPSTTKGMNTGTKKKTDAKQVVKLSKEQRLEEKLRKQREKEEKRAEKLAAQELQKQMKPGYCMKFIRVIFDSSLVTCPFGGALIAAIQSSESKYEVSENPVPLTVSWTRELPGGSSKEEEELVLIWQWQLVIPAIKIHSLCSQIKEIQATNPSKTISLVIYGLNGYFSYLKSRRRNTSADPPKPKKGKRSSDSQEYPYVTRKDIEEELVELQIMASCNHRLIDSPEELGQLILQITKAIAERPYKLDKQRREQESLEWFATGDSRDCVTVDKAGNGLLRLWQQQLCQFNLANHDIAQAIAVVYPSPRAIVQAYDKCNSQKEAEELLKDIPVRRCQGPMSSSRRIGPELSKKIYKFFCSLDGDAPLSQEQ